MRAVISAACLVGAAITLQGCGGGGGGPTPAPPGPAPGPSPPGPSPGPSPGGKCLNPSIDLVTQSITQSATITADITSGATPMHEKMTATGPVKFDMEKWNARVDSTILMNMKMEKPAINMDMKVDEKMILDVSKKLIVLSYTMSNATSGKVLKTNCSAITVTKMPAALELTLAWGVLKKKMQTFAKCAGNDGTYDTWDVNFVHKKGDKWPLPMPKTTPPMDVNVDMKIQMDKNYLIHSETGTIDMQSDAEGKTPATTVKESIGMTVSESSASGPADEDLDWSKWGTEKDPCTPITPPNQDFLKDLQGSKKSTMQNLIIATLQASMESQTTEIVV